MRFAVAGGLGVIILLSFWRADHGVVAPSPDSTPGSGNKSTPDAVPPILRGFREPRSSATADDPLAGALLGDPGAWLSPEARRMLGQACLSLAYVDESVRRHYVGASPNDSFAAVQRAYGRVLFLNDYNYAVRACPELDPTAGETVYTNAVRGLAESGLAEIAKDAAGTQPVSRPEPPLTEHYRQAFESGLPPETTAGYSNVLTTLERSVGYDPRATDLFNDAVIYVMSKTDLEEMAEADRRVFAMVQAFEAGGAPPDLETLSGAKRLDVDDSAEALFDDGGLTATALAACRDIFSQRFAQNHGITDESFMDELDKLRIPLTGTWVIIYPPHP
ncbi:MAG: hypothetical protein H7A46_19650 [Verrucomicrobiales bacterium]|nr:hypothetical protein [Verrucomicrobiales bacterium]